MSVLLITSVMFGASSDFHFDVIASLAAIKIWVISALYLGRRSFLNLILQDLL